VKVAILAVPPGCDVGNAELTAVITAHEPSPEAGSTRLAPTEAQLSAGKGACAAMVLYDGSQGGALSV
jgi:hypothetical protein